MDELADLNVDKKCEKRTAVFRNSFNEKRGLFEYLGSNFHWKWG